MSGRKAAGFPGEGGPAILAADVLDEVIGSAVGAVCFPPSQGVVPFDEGAGLEALRGGWAAPARRLALVEGP